MPRRVNLPGADELFRGQPAAAHKSAENSPAPEADAQPTGPTGRVRHDEKITVYVSTQELLELEQARLQLRMMGLNADRGRLVREAIDMMLENLHESGADSAIAKRLGA